MNFFSKFYLILDLYAKKLSYNVKNSDQYIRNQINKFI